MQLQKNSSFQELDQQQLSNIDGGILPFVIAAAKGAAYVGGALTGATGLYFAGYKVGEHFAQ